nr:DUF3784 domain-containing protein [Bacteroidales bacterium]
MDIVNIITGLFLIGIGFLVKYSPGLIAGYNTMPEDKKKNVDIDGLSTFMRNSLIIIGLSIIGGYYLFKWMGVIQLANSVIMIVILIGVTIMIIKAQRFDHNENKSNKTKLTYFITGLVIIFVTGLITYGFIPTKAIIKDGNIKFTGMYGFEMNVSEIDDIRLSDKLPGIKMRTNGLSLGGIDKGFYSVDHFGRTRLLINSRESPFLIISGNKNETAIISFRD